MMNDKLCKVVDVFEENGMYNDINVQWAEDHDGNYYAIVDSNSDEDKFEIFVKETVEIEDSVERDLEIEIVYSDEYTTCSDCGHIIRTSPTHYGWQPDFYVGDGFIVCNECFIENGYAEDYIQEKINQPKNAINGLVTEVELQKMGFSKFNENSYESGYHYGQTDDPEKIYDELSDKYEEIVFFIDRAGQFDIHFSVWVRGEI
jgi:hypothetical protein